MSWSNRQQPVRPPLLAAAVLAACGLTQSTLVSAAEPGQHEGVSKALLPGDVEGTVRFSGSRTSFGLGGYIEAHVGASDFLFTANQAGTDSLSFPQISVGSEENGAGDSSRVHARQSRLWFKTYTPTDFGELNFFFEYDLSERPGSYRPRQRHAYVSLGQILIGQAYTTFTNSASQPDTDSGLPPANVGTRHNQLRWTLPLPDPDMDLMLALEQPGSRVNRIAEADIQQYDNDHDPNFAVRLNRYGSWGEVSLSAMTRSLRWLDNGRQIRTRANAIGLSGRVTTSGLNNLRFVFNGGYGLGSFLTSRSYPDALYSAIDHTLESSRVRSAEVSYQHYWSERWRSNLVLSESRIRLPESANPLLTKKARALQLNLFFNPQPDLTLGVEYLHASRHVRDGRDGDLDRLLLMARYTFQTR